MADSATLASYGIDKPSVLHHNLSYEAIAEHEQKREEGQFVKTQDKEGETCAVDTGKFTGRSPKDKFIVRQVCAPVFAPCSIHADFTVLSMFRPRRKTTSGGGQLTSQQLQKFLKNCKLSNHAASETIVWNGLRW